MTMHAGGKQSEMLVSYYDDGSIEIKAPPGKLCDPEAIWLWPLKKNEKNLCNAKTGQQSESALAQESAL